jgi:hypothetical protein
MMARPHRGHNSCTRRDRRSQVCLRLMFALMPMFVALSCGEDLPALGTGQSGTSSADSSSGSESSETNGDDSSLSALTSESDLSSQDSTLMTSSASSSATPSDGDSSSTFSDSMDSTQASSSSSTAETSTSTATSGPSKKSDGEYCTQDFECASTICGLNSRCGECRNDAQCVAKAKRNCTMNAREVPVCSGGALGERCESDSSCEHGICHRRFASDLQGICSTCADAQSCRDAGLGKNCQFQNDSGSSRAWWTCTPGELGERCEEDSDCSDAFCHPHPLLDSGFGLCSSCENDAQCRDLGLGRNCVARWEFMERAGAASRNAAKVSFACSQGELGEACEGMQSCRAPLVCADLGVLNLFGGGVCSPCAGDIDCSMGEVCSVRRDRPAADETPIDRLTCVNVGEAAHSTWCTPKADPSQDACLGSCTALAHVKDGKLGLCGECQPGSTLGCSAGKSCVAPMIDPVTGPVGAHCE